MVEPVTREEAIEAAARDILRDHNEGDLDGYAARMQRLRAALALPTTPPSAAPTAEPSENMATIEAAVRAGVEEGAKTMRAYGDNHVHFHADPCVARVLARLPPSPAIAASERDAEREKALVRAAFDAGWERRYADGSNNEQTVAEYERQVAIDLADVHREIDAAFPPPAPLPSRTPETTWDSPVVRALMEAQSTAWPIAEVLLRLADATRHLLHGHSCDDCGHEERRGAMLAAEEMLRRAGLPHRYVRPGTTDPVVEGSRPSPLPPSPRTPGDTSERDETVKAWAVRLLAAYGGLRAAEAYPELVARPSVGPPPSRGDTSEAVRVLVGELADALDSSSRFADEPASDDAILIARARGLLAASPLPSPPPSPLPVDDGTRAGAVTYRSHMQRATEALADAFVLTDDEDEESAAHDLLSEVTDEIEADFQEAVDAAICRKDARTVRNTRRPA